MKKFYRAMAATLGIIMLAGTLGACGGGTGSTTSVSGTQASNVQNTTKDSSNEEQVTLRFVNWQTNHSAANQKIVDAFENENPNIKVEIEYIGDMSSQEYLKKVDIMLMGNEKIDLVMTPSVVDFSTRASSMSYLPLDEYFSEEGKSIDDIYSSQMAVDGKHYGIASDMKYNIVLINKQMLDDAGLPVPSLDWTWEDYAEYAKKMTHGDGANRVYGSYLHNWSSTMTMGMQTKKVGNPLFKTPTELFVTEPTFKMWMEYVNQIENIDKVSTPLADIKSLNMNYRDQFFTGKIAMLPMATYMIPEIGNEKYPHDFVTTFAPIPTWDDGTPGMVAGAPLIYSIAKTSEHPEEAFKYLRFMTTEGVKIKSMFISSEVGADKMEYVAPMVENFKELVDVEALEAVMTNPNWKDNPEDFVPTYHKEVETLLYEEFEKYLLGAVDIDAAITNMVKNAQVVIDKNQ